MATDSKEAKNSLHDGDKTELRGPHQVAYS